MGIKTNYYKIKYLFQLSLFSVYYDILRFDIKLILSANRLVKNRNMYIFEQTEK